MWSTDGVGNNLLNTATESNEMGELCWKQELKLKKMQDGNVKKIFVLLR
jgi:hypothetical protein